MRRAIKAATKAELQYQDRARELGCVVCRWRMEHGYQDSQFGQGGPTHIHHRNLDDKHGQKQLGQHAVVALCAWHHDGIRGCWGLKVDGLREIYGPSFKYAKDFREWTADVLSGIPGRGTECWQVIQDQYLGMNDEF